MAEINTEFIKETRKLKFRKPAYGGLRIAAIWDRLLDACDRLEQADTFKQAITSRHNGYLDADCVEPKSARIALSELLAEAEKLGCSEREEELRAKIERLEKTEELYAAATKALNSQIEANNNLKAKIEQQQKDVKRLNWLDLHTAFVADEEYLIGPYKTGELRKMADDGIAIDKVAIAQAEQLIKGE